MTIYDELVARGLIAQVTDEKEIKELIRPSDPEHRADNEECVIKHHAEYGKPSQLVKKVYSFCGGAVIHHFIYLTKLLF